MGEKEELEVVVTLKDQASPKAKEVGQSLSKGLGQLGSLAMGGIAIGATAAIAGIGAVGLGLNVAIGEALEAQENLAQLDAVLKATGGTSGMTRDSIVELADSLAQMVTYTDDEIIAGETMLLQFKNIGEDVFPQATQTMLDLATRLGIDVPSAAKMLGKALETPGEGLARLKAAGVAFTDEQTDMVKAMEEAGDSAGAQKFIMDALAGSIGGAAQAAGETLGGQWTIMKNTLANTAEEIGTALLPALTEAFAQIKPVIMDLAAGIAEFVKSDEFKVWIEKIINWLKTDLPIAITTAKDFWNNQLVPAFEKMKPILDKVWPLLEKIGNFLGVVIPPILTAFVSGWELAFKAIDLALTPIKNMVKAWESFIKIINEVKTALANLTLPDWLTPGSPTPLEVGIRGITDALGGIGGSVPSFSANISQMSAPAIGVGSGGYGGITVVYSPGMSLGNQSEFESQFIPMLQRALRKVNRGEV